MISKKYEDIRNSISKLLDETYYPTVLDREKGASQWAWKTKEGRENNRRNVYTIIFGSPKLLVVAGDMLDQENVNRLGFERRKEHAVVISLAQTGIGR